MAQKNEASIIIDSRKYLLRIFSLIRKEKIFSFLRKKNVVHVEKAPADATSAAKSVIDNRQVRRTDAALLEGGSAMPRADGRQ